MMKDDPSNLSSEPNQPSKLVELHRKLSPETIIAEKYRVSSLLGSGGMGTVYVARQIFLSKDFALKLLNSSNHPDVVRRFQQEARTTAQLRHPNLVVVHDFGVYENDHPFLIMDLVQGYTLAKILKRSGTLAIDYVIALATEVSHGLNYAHSQGVVHRDVKPSNIMILNAGEQPARGTVKILDFGIAKLLQSTEGEIQELTKTGEIFGSPIYMSPEQCQGADIDCRSDIYALGCVIFECLSGSPPFLGDNAMSTMLKRLTDDPPTLKEASLGMEFPSALETIVRKMLAVDPEKRYQNFDDVIADFEQLSKTLHTNIDKSLPENEGHQNVPPKRRLVSLKDLSIVALTAILSCLLMALLDRYLIFQEQFSPGNAVRARDKKLKAQSDDRTNAEKIFIDLKESLKYPSRELKSDGVVTREILHFPTNVGKIGFYRETGWWPAQGDFDTHGKVINLSLNEDAGADPQILRNLLDVNFGLIRFPGKYRLTNETLVELGKLKHLKQLDINGGDISSLNSITNLHLRALDVSQTRVRSSDIIGLKHLDELEHLEFGPVDKPTMVLSQLLKKNSLNGIVYEGSLPSENESRIWGELSKFDVDLIVQMPQLHSIMFQNCPQINDECIAKLLKMNRPDGLAELTIEDCAITPKSIQTFRKMTFLQRLILTAKNWTPKEIAEVKNLPVRVYVDAPVEARNSKSQNANIQKVKDFQMNEPRLEP